jgi:quaternary ammonium compound-resistance protein SugE
MQFERTGTFDSNLERIHQVAWVYLAIAGLFEVGWAIGLKYTDGFTRLWPSVATIIAMIASFSLLGEALKAIPLGTGYAVWTGIGAAGTAVLGMLFLGESRELLRILCLLLIVAGVVGLKFGSAAGH